jgi:hypothetical protein
VRDAAKDTAVLWINKGGKVNKGTFLRIMALIEKEGCGDDGWEELKGDLNDEYMEGED